MKRRTWPLFLISLPAAVAVWSGWVGLGALCGFGVIHPLPGIWDNLRLNTAITLPVGVEAYGGYALGVWADSTTPAKVRKFAFRSAIGSLLLGLMGQVVFHLLSAAGYARAPWPVVVFVSCIPVAALGFGMGLHQLLVHADAGEDQAGAGAQLVPVPSAVDLFDEMARTITPGQPEPLPWPDAPMTELGYELTDPEIEAVLKGWAEPQADAEPTGDDIAAEAEQLFGAAPEPVPPARPAPRPAPKPAPRTVPRPPAAKPAGRKSRAELLAERTAGLPVPRPVTGTWTPEKAGLTGEQVRQILDVLPRNDLVDFLGVSRSAASRIRDEYGRPALAGANGSR